MPLKICFLMYPWERVEPETDTTLRIIHECAVRGHTVAIATTSSLTIRDSVASAFCDVLKRSKSVADNIPAFYRKAEFKRVLLPLSGFDAIFMRCNPPLDLLTLNFLDSVRDDTFILNGIDGLRIANNKLYTAAFQNIAKDYIPATHVSKSREYLQQVIEESDQDKMILKPLDGYGGQGVIVVEKSARDNLRSLLDFYISGKDGQKGNYVILQDYVEGAENGDVRILMLNGEPIGAMRRIPARGDVRSNIHAGGSVIKHTLSREEKELCRLIGPKLVRDELYFVGIDVIGGKLIEVNVMSPGGIMRINRLNRVKLQRQVVDFIEGVVHSREALIIRKKSFRQIIEDADTL